MPLRTRNRAAALENAERVEAPGGDRAIKATPRCRPGGRVCGTPLWQPALPRLRDGSESQSPVLGVTFRRCLKAALLCAVRVFDFSQTNRVGAERSERYERGTAAARSGAVGAEPRSAHGPAAGSTGRTGSAPPWDGGGLGSVRARSFPEGLAKQRPPGRPSSRSTVRRGMGQGQLVCRPRIAWGRDVSCCGMQLCAGNPHLCSGQQRGTPAEMDAPRCSLCRSQRPSLPARVRRGCAAQQSALRPSEGPSLGTAEPCGIAVMLPEGIQCSQGAQTWAVPGLAGRFGVRWCCCSRRGSTHTLCPGLCGRGAVGAGGGAPCPTEMGWVHRCLKLLQK